VRLAATSALLTFVILCAFALAVGWITVHRIRADFNRQVTDTANGLPSRLDIKLSASTVYEGVVVEPPLTDFVPPTDHAVIRIFTLGGSAVEQAPANAPSLGFPEPGTRTIHGYRVLSRVGVVRTAVRDEPVGSVIIQYGRRVSDTEATVARVELFLVLGVLAGSGLALLAGMAIARRAMAPIAELTSTAAEIARTRDLRRRVPEPKADDEVAELARTLRGMLRELDAARADTEDMLARQRRFVADASHELRTPLTTIRNNAGFLRAHPDARTEDRDSALADLDAEAVRMTRLVEDLLTLARAEG